MIKEQIIFLCNNKKQRIFSLTVVIYFFIYAASPLIYISDKQTKHNVSLQQKKPLHFQQTCIFLFYDFYILDFNIGARQRNFRTD